MNKKIIKKAGRDVTVAALKSRDYTELKKITAAAEKDASEVFTAVADGSARVAWYDMPPVTTRSGDVSVMRYALHRSTKKDGFLQLSCMELKGGQIIPTGDLQFNISDGIRDFFRELPTKTEIFIN